MGQKLNRQGARVVFGGSSGSASLMRWNQRISEDKGHLKLEETTGLGFPGGPSRGRLVDASRWTETPVSIHLGFYMGFLQLSGARPACQCLSAASLGSLASPKTHDPRDQGRSSQAFMILPQKLY